MAGRTLRQATGRAVSGRMVRNYLALLRLPAEVQELASAANLTEFRLRPLVSLDDPHVQIRMVKRIVEGNLSGRQVGTLLKEAAGIAGERRAVGQSRAKALTAQGLKRRLRSLAAYLEKHVQDVGGSSTFAAELRGVEEYRVALNEMVNLRDLLHTILDEMETDGHRSGARMRSREPAND